MNAISGIRESGLLPLAGTSKGPFLLILDYLSLPEVARSSSTCKALSQRAVEYLRSPSIRQSLQIPEGEDCVEYLRRCGVPTVAMALRKLKDAIENQDLRKWQHYLIEMPLNPGCRVKGSMIALNPDLRSQNLSPPVRMLVATRKGLPFCMGKISCVQLVNELRRVAHMEPLRFEQEARVLETMRERVARRRLGDGVCFESTLPPFPLVDEGHYAALTAFPTPPAPAVLPDSNEILPTDEQLMNHMSAPDQDAFGLLYGDIQMLLYRSAGGGTFTEVSTTITRLRNEEQDAETEVAAVIRRRDLAIERAAAGWRILEDFILTLGAFICCQSMVRWAVSFIF